VDFVTALYLLAAHMVGDYLLQTRWQAAAKFEDAWARTRHVLGYCVPFVPVAFYAAPSARQAVVFLAALYVLHFLTDARRVRSTLGEVLAWRLLLPPSQKADELQEERLRVIQPGEYHSTPALLKVRPSDEQAARAKLPANPWPTIPLAVDQTLHLAQLAVLGGLLLR
jgi:hypothetical protein